MEECVKKMTSTKQTTFTEGDYVSVPSRTMFLSNEDYDRLKGRTFKIKKVEDHKIYLDITNLYFNDGTHLYWFSKDELNPEKNLCIDNWRNELCH